MEQFRTELIFTGNGKKDKQTNKNMMQDQSVKTENQLNISGNRTFGINIQQPSVKVKHPRRGVSVVPLRSESNLNGFSKLFSTV